MNSPHSLAKSMSDATSRFTPSERRVAELVSQEPEVVAFGTIAELAKRTGTSGPTVVRFAERLGFAGYAALQSQIRLELAERLRPARQRLQSTSDSSGLADRVLAAEVSNLERTLANLDEELLANCVALLANKDSQIFVLPSEQTLAVTSHFTNELKLLRYGVHLVQGSEFGVATQLAAATPEDLAVVVDLRRHERWVLRATRRLAERGIPRIAVTNSALSPLASGAELSLLVSASSIGPFDSHIGMLALFNTIIANLASNDCEQAVDRIGILEREWTNSGVLEADSGSDQSRVWE